MPVLKTTSPAEAVSAPKLSPVNLVPSLRMSVAVVIWAAFYQLNRFSEMIFEFFLSFSLVAR